MSLSATVLSNENHKARHINLTSVICAIIAILLFISSNTLYYGYTGTTRPRSIMQLLIIILVLSYIIISWYNKKLDSNWITIQIIWIFFLLLIYIIIAFATGDFGSNSTMAFFALLALLPSFIKFLFTNDQWAILINVFLFTVLIFAIIALILWIFGPITSIIQSNCELYSTWYSTPRSVNGYFWLLFETQTFTINGESIVRNTSIFTEAPMYSFILCIALGFELLFRKKSRIFYVIIFTVSIFTTLSTTGIIFCSIAIVLTGFIKTRQIKSTSVRIICYLCLFILLLTAISVSIYLSLARLETNSGLTRIDDFSAGATAWLNSPLYGNGFDDMSTVRDEYSSFRINNTGFSNSPMAILATGGILYLLPDIICFCGFLFKGTVREKLFGIGFIYLWVFTIVYRLPITAFVLAIGFIMLWENNKENKNTLTLERKLDNI